MRQQYILALDQGTTSSRSILFDKSGNQVAVAQKEFTQLFPHPGHVEHDPMEIWDSQLQTARQVLAKANVDASNIAAIGITNQRETTIIWDKKTGQPVYNAIVWQDRRTAPICEEIKKKKDLAKYIIDSTGLVIDPYFSGTKIKWILDNVKGARKRAEDGELCFGTVDTWLTYSSPAASSTLLITAMHPAHFCLISKPKNGMTRSLLRSRYPVSSCLRSWIPASFMA